MSDYHVQEWMPKLQQTADELIKKIAEVAPELQVLFMGAAALGLPGKNDIDLDILCKHVDVKRYASVLTPILGAPQKLRDDMAIWSYKKDGIEIDCILSDPA